MDLAKLQIAPEQTGTPDVEDLGIIVRCYSEVGTMQGMGKIEVTARETISVDARHIAHYVTVQVEPSAEYGQPGSAVIRYDDISKVLRAIEALRATNPQSTKFAHMEAEFSLEDLRLIVFNSANGQLMCAVHAGAATAYLSDLRKLGELATLLSRAKSVIDDNRSK